LRFAGRRVFVTGGGTGIGRAVASGFAAEGARVAIASRDLPRLEAAAREMSRGGASVLPLRVDVRDRASTDACADRAAGALGGIDVLVNNAGVSGRTPIGSAEDDGRLLDILTTNLVGVFYMTRAALRHMPDGGRVINNASVLAKFGVAGYAAYCASKHGLVGLTRALALELAPRRITVNAVCPGWVDTAMSDQGVRESAAAQGLPPEAFRAAAAARVPLGRFMAPEEVVPLILHIASEESAMMTGQAVNLDGGQAMW
jgi:NAD(P)-dependent dehydrogenase (short-subunit alcohol dehydrogenase family)